MSFYPSANALSSRQANRWIRAWLLFYNNYWFFFLGVYKPRVRCYETSELCMKFERCLDSESKFHNESLLIIIWHFQ